MKIALSPQLKLPVELVTESVAILARRRMGKSNTAKVLVEQLFTAGQQVVVVDPKGDWWGLRSSRDGKGPGLPIVIAGGEHGDVPVESTGGELVARLVVEQRVSIVLDLSKFRKHEVAAFMAAFLETLYRLKAKEEYRTPVMLAIDEADAIAPQKPYKGEERMLGAAEDIVRRGGQRGIGVILVSQRAAVLNKNVLTQASILIALGTTGSQDLDALDEWIKKHGQPAEREQLMGAIAQLPRGTAWVWAPGWPDERGIFRQVEIALCETFDSGATPKPGERRVVPKTVADVDLDAFRREMAATIEKAKADDPRALRAEVAELKRQLAVKATSTPVADKVTSAPRVVEKRVLKDHDHRRLEVVIKDARHQADRFEKLSKVLQLATEATVNAAVDFSDRAVALDKTIRDAMLPPDVARAAHIMRGNIPPSPTVTHPVTRPTWRGGTVEQRILDALAELEQLGAQRPARELVAFLAGYSNLASKGFVNAVSALRTAGAIDYPDAGTVALTEAGRRRAAPPERPRTPAELQARVIAMLGGASGRILAPLIEAYPDAMKRVEVAARAGYGNLASKGFVNAISRLRSLGFVNYPDSGSIVAAPVLFLEGGR